MWNLNVPCKYTIYNIIIHINNIQLSDLLSAFKGRQLLNTHINLHIVLFSQNTYKSVIYSNKIDCILVYGKKHLRLHSRVQDMDMLR